jgi:thiol-disulfide isomerase/thioredoxin
MSETGLVVCAGVLLLATVFGLVRAARDGRLRRRRGGDEVRLSAAELGAQLGESVTLVQFSTSFCQPCRGTRRLLGDVAAATPGVVHVEIDAEVRLDLARQLQVLRTPTVLVLDRGGRVVRRASGPPGRAEVLSAVAEAAGGSAADAAHAAHPGE